MAIIVCQCGQQLQIDQPSAQGYLCPTCGAVVGAAPAVQPQPQFAGSQDVAYAPVDQYGYYGPPQRRPEANTDATLGFVLAMVSFFTCMVVAPFAIYFSVRGLKKPDNQGLAIAGLIIGIFETVVLVGVAIYLAFIIFVIGTMGASMAGVAAEASKLHKESVQTDRALTQARNDLAMQFGDDQEVPSEEDGNATISRHRDAWGNELRYSRESQSRATVTSPGPDGRFGSIDDQVTSWRAGWKMPSTSFATSGVDTSTLTFDALKKAIQSSSYSERRNACREIATRGPDPEFHDQVIEMMLPLLSDSSSSSQASEVLMVWATTEDAPALLNLFSETGGIKNATMASPVMDVLEKIEAHDQVASLMTHADSFVASTAERKARSMQISNETIAKFCILALDEPKRRYAALRHLENVTPIESLRVEVNKKVGAGLSDGGASQSYAIRVLRKWGVTKESLEGLGKAHEYSMVASVSSQESLEVLQNGFSDYPRGTLGVASELKKIGPAAESCVWPMVETGDLPRVLQACRVLESIGTEKSIPYLKKRQDEGVLKRTVERTIRRIETSGRRPTTEWENH